MIKWQKSSFSSGSDGANCVELAQGEGETLLRESDEPRRILAVGPRALTGLLRHLQADPLGSRK
ncbi:MULTISPECIES: DUF397 domain-containing protein [unclassified Streptomyces]|uniref:DUF397 domain-containing protein n=1 Tax=unclassified Streptomyces TaxID=2593676 RepID=UPI0004BE5D52|nr:MULTISPECIES: DUF397 domain-containing protein [unclassified Streptomyces]